MLRRLALLTAPMVLLGGLVAAPARATDQQIITWNFTQADVMNNEQLGDYGSGVTVAVLDSGVDGSLPDFGGRVLSGADCTSGTCVASSGAPNPSGCSQYWHGTHVAGTIASSTYGVAPLAHILPVVVLKPTGSGDCSASSGSIANAIVWAVNNGAQVINLSLGDIPGNPAPTPGVQTNLQSAASYAAQHGVLVVDAAGNNSTAGNRQTVNDDYGPGAVVVAATGPSGALASYSDAGGVTAFAAPGGDCPGAVTKDCGILSTVPTSFYPNGYALAVGTSMAAPHVSGLAALLFAQNPGISRNDVIQAMASTAVPLEGTSAGRIDVGAALGVRPNADLQVPAFTGLPGASTVTAFVGCPSKVTALKGRKAMISCRRYPGGVSTVKLQQRTSKGWITVFTSKTSKDGHFRAYSKAVKGNQTLRLISGAATTTVKASVKKAAKKK